MPPTIQVLIVEDDFIISDYIQSCLVNLGYAVVAICSSYDEAIAALKNLKPDIALIDISIKGEKNGIEIGSYISQHLKIPFVFASSHGDRGTIDLAKQTKPYAYLIKPFTEDDLYAVIETALVNFAKQHPIVEQEEEELIIINDGIFIKHKNKFIKIVLKDLIYMEANDNYVQLHTIDTHYTLKTSLIKLEATLPTYFFRIQKSYIVNLHELKSFDGEEVVIANKTLPIGKIYYDSLFKKLQIVKG